MKVKTQQKIKDEFMEYYEKYQDDIFRFCFVKTKNRQDALDLTQDTFMRLWDHMVKGKEVSNERPLLYRIANNLIIDFYRKKKSIQIEDYVESVYGEQLVHNEEERNTNRLDGERIIPILEQLPKSTQEIIKLRFLHDLSIKEIAQTLDKEAKTVSVYLHRGIKQLREILKEYE